MATVTRILVDVGKAGPLYSVATASAKATSKASELLQQNHETNDLIFNSMGFHNHIVHHILTSHSLGAEPELMQRHYNREQSYQRKPRKLDVEVVNKLRDPEFFLQKVSKGNLEMTNNFLTFFTAEIDKNGWKETLAKFLFGRDKVAETMFSRLYAGILHPFIHLGFAVEYEQPALVAEALAQAAIHPAYQDSWFAEVEAQSAKLDGSKVSSMIKLLDNISQDEKLSRSAKISDADTIKDGVFVRARQEMTDYASQWRVKEEDDLPRKAAELINAATYVVAGALRPDKEVKFDFFYLHAVTSSLFLPLLMKADWIPHGYKVKVLNWKGRYDLLLYTSWGARKSDLSTMRSYKPQHANQSWQDLIARAAKVTDDGHTCKLIRGLTIGEQYCKAWEDRHPESFPIRGSNWITIANMVLDAVESAGEERWVRGAGFEEAWDGIKDR